MKILRNSLAIIIIVTLLLLARRFLNDYSLCELRLPTLINYLLAPWIIYFLLNMFKFDSTKGKTAALTAATCGMLLSIFLGRGFGHWSVYAMTIAALLIGFLTVRGYVYLAGKRKKPHEVLSQER